MLPQTMFDLDIALSPVQSGDYRVELRFNDPTSDAGGLAAFGSARFDFEALKKETIDDSYADTLTNSLFLDDAVRDFYRDARQRAIAGTLRLRLFLHAESVEINTLRWELLRHPDPDPAKRIPFATSERILFSRFVVTRDWRPISLRPQAHLRALVAVSSPPNLPAGMAPVRREIEIPAARKALEGIETAVLGDSPDNPVTLTALIDEIRKGVDIVYLVCHGSFPADNVARLYLQKPNGDFIAEESRALAQAFATLQQPPRLMVLASCHGAGNAGRFSRAALAPMLTDAGVPAVLAMQGEVQMETVEAAMPVFFRELRVDGQIDRAMAVARARIRDVFKDDFWVPALFLRLKGGCIWYTPGFGTANEEEIWKPVCNAIVTQELVPIVGPDLGEHLLGSTAEFASALRAAANLPKTDGERPDSAKIAQAVVTLSGRNVLVQKIAAIVTERLQLAASRLNPEAARDLLLNDEFLEAIVTVAYQNPDDPFRILSDLDLKVYVSGAMDDLLRRYLKKKGKRPFPICSDWRDERKGERDRVIEYADVLLKKIAEAAASAPLTRSVVFALFESWKDGMTRAFNGKTPTALLLATDTLNEYIVEATNATIAAVLEDWSKSIRTAPAELDSSPWPTETPVLYYVFGKYTYDSSWVLTEDDFFDFLIHQGSYPSMPGFVSEKLVANALLFLGFSMDDWKFRTLFRLILSKPGSGYLDGEKFKHIGVQVDPEQYTQAEAARVKRFLQKYFQNANINIYWGSSADFLIGLRDRMKAPEYQEAIARRQAEAAAKARIRKQFGLNG